jgi:hypothetical protein
MTLFATVEMAPRDPILGLNEQFNAASCRCSSAWPQPKRR